MNGPDGLAAVCAVGTEPELPWIVFHLLRGMIILLHLCALLFYLYTLLFGCMLDPRHALAFICGSQPA